MAGVDDTVVCNPSACSHCWHMSEFQHAMMNHYDQYCCRCGSGECVDTTSQVEAYAKKHGPFYKK